MDDSTGTYRRLLDIYGPQGWWPIPGRAGEPGYNAGGYHPGIFPEWDAFDRFQITLGAILTQNTTWKNARIALERIIEGGIHSAEDLLSTEPAHLANLIRASGYYNQKVKKLRFCAAFLHERRNLITGIAPSRKDLLDIWGIGPETADSILLYAFGVPVFVIDAYTKRFFSRINPGSADYTYEELQHYFTRSLPREVELFQEFHALMVRHCKDVCRNQPECVQCDFAGSCSYGCLNSK